MMKNTPENTDISVLGLQMLAWLAKEPERLAAFCDATGYTVDSLKSSIAGPEVALAALEYLLGDESLLLQFCAETGTPPDLPLRLWQRWQHGA